MTASTKRKHITEMVYRPLDSLKKHPKNPRTIKDKSFKQLVASINENPDYFEARPIILSDRTGELIIIAGNQRYSAAKDIGIKDVPTVLIPALTEEKEREIMIRDNIANGDWDWDMLANDWDSAELTEWGLDVPGWEDGSGAGNAGQTDADDVPEPEENPVSKLGDLWVLGEHRLLCGDSTSLEAVDRLMDGKKADFCFTSPPYNAALKCEQMHSKAPKIGGKGLYSSGYSDNRTSEEYIAFNQRIFDSMASIASDRFSCCYNINYNKNSPSEYLDVALAGRRVMPLVETIVWEKAMAVSLQGDNLTRIYEFIFVFAKSGLKINKGRNDCERNLWKVSNIGANHDTHKACFPVELVERGISLFSPEAGAVYEPFGGSGTTLIACEKTGRTAYLMELDAKYCDVIINRWQNFTGEKAILESTGETFEEVKNGRAS